MRHDLGHSMESIDANLPIGVFDSGVGGFTVVKALKRYLPSESIVYLGDSARVPYGTKSKETVIQYSIKNAAFMVNQRIKLLIVACNTASAHAVGVLRERLEIPVIGVIEPGAKAAVEATRSGFIGIIGTLGTVTSGVYDEKIHLLTGGRMQTQGEPCGLFVPLADEGWISGEVPRLVAQKYLSELQGRIPELDTIILGCTHYPVLRDTIQEVANELFQREITLIDSGISTALAVRAFLEERDALSTNKLRGDVRVFVTDSSHISSVGTRFLGEPIGFVERVDIT